MQATFLPDIFSWMRTKHSQRNQLALHTHQFNVFPSLRKWACTFWRKCDLPSSQVICIKKKEVTWLASKETSLPSLNSVGLENAHQNLLGSYDTNYAWKRLYKDCSVDKFWFRPRFRKVCTRWVWSLQRNGVKVWLLLNKVQAGWKTSCFIFQDYFWFDSFRGLRQYQLGWIKFGTESRCL